MDQLLIDAHRLCVAQLEEHLLWLRLHRKGKALINVAERLAGYLEYVRLVSEYEEEMRND